LKGAGQESTERGQIISAFERDVAQEMLREKAAALLMDVRKAYFKVLLLREEASYRDSSIKLANEILAHSRAKVEAGVFKPMESLEAEVGLIRRKTEKIDTEKDYLDALDELGSLLGGKLESQINAKIEQLPKVALDENEALSNAISKRPELLLKMIEIQKSGFENELSQKDLLPQLDLVGSYGRMGLGGDFGDSLDDFSGGGHHSWQIGLSLNFPLGNKEGRGERLRSENVLKGQKAKLNQIVLDVRNEIHRSARLVRIQEEKMALASQERELAEKKLQNLLQLYEEGIVSTRQVLEGEEDLEKSHSALRNAKASYNIAATIYQLASGALLDSEGRVLPSELSAAGGMPVAVKVGD
jgi:outer membrane protein TolC